MEKIKRFKNILKNENIYFNLIKKLKLYYKKKYQKFYNIGNEQAYLYLAALESLKAFLKGEVPIGAVVVAPDGKVFKAHNLKENLKDPSAHAEILAIRKASNYYKNWYLNNFKIYITLEPCIMCFGCILESRINYICYAAPEKKYGFSNFLKRNNSFLNLTIRNYNLSDIIIPIKIFFKLLRNK